MTQENNRNQLIDILRGVSIFLVMLLHFHLSFSMTENLWLKTIISNGNYGVTIFFVISGYLITSNCQKRYGNLTKIKLTNFYLMRTSRILPNIILALLLIIVLANLGFSSFGIENGIKISFNAIYLSALSVLTFWQNVLMSQWGYFNYPMNIYWSLSVEEIFYLLFPIVAILTKHRFSLVLFLAIIAGPIYRFYHQENDIMYMYQYLACFDALAFGCSAGLLKDKVKITRPIQLLALFLLALVFMKPIYTNQVFGFSLVAFFAAILVISSSQLKCQSHLGWLEFFGSHSYELYLFHIIVLGLMRDIFLKSDNIIMLLLFFFGSSLFVAYMIAKYYAEPLKNMIRQRI